MPTLPLAIDFETKYGGDYTLRKMSTWDYIHDERFDAYLVSAYNDEFSWVGHPKSFDWTKIKGQVLLAHNANFDGLVLKRLRDLGIVPVDCVEEAMYCTADLTAYLRCMRDLKTAAKYLLGIEVDKSMRGAMAGKSAEDAAEAGLTQALDDYALEDARLCYLLWKNFGDKWPENEREYSRRLREAGWRGLPVALPAAQEALADLELQAFELQKSIPWVADDKPPLSPHALRAEGRKVGIPVPASLAKTDAAAAAWFEEYGDKYPWVRAVRDYRSLNAHLSKVKGLVQGVRNDGTFPPQVKYFGAHSGRTSAGSGDATGGKFNPLNMPRKAMFGVDLRRFIEAPKKQALVIADFEQIEAVLLLWAAGDTEGLNRVRETGSPYVAYAIQAGWCPPGSTKATIDPDLYLFAKVSVLLLGYQGGAAKFKHAAKVVYGVDMTMERAVELVTQFRATNPKIVNYWKDQDIWLKVSANHGDPTHEVALHSGRDLVYFEPHFVTNPKSGYSEVEGKVFRGSSPSKLYGGILTENAIQATARDVLRDARNAVERAGHNVILDVYDELVCMVPESEAEDRAKDITRLMTTSSPWAEGCPLGASFKISKQYCK